MDMLRKLRRVVFFCIFSLGLLMVLVTFTPAVPWYARQLGGAWDDPHGEILIVLGGGAIDDEMLATNSYWRCVNAARIWRIGGFRELVVTGAGVAPQMRDFFVCHGVPAGSIRVENAAGSTRENALYTKRLLAGAPGRRVLVTSDYHTFRARHVFAKVGLDVRCQPFPDVVKISRNLLGRWDGFLTVTRETAKIAYYKLRGWI
jgi:uncharacterized SAM-binding protein YcdF (DUF218 family)